MLCYIVLYHTILYYTMLYYTILYYTILYYTILCYTILHCTTLHYTAVHYTALHCTTPHYTTLHYTTLCYTMPHNKHQCCRSRILFNVTCVRLARGSGGSPRNGGTGTPIPAAHAMPPSARPHRFCTRFVIMVCPNLRLKGASYVGPLFY